MAVRFRSQTVHPNRHYKRKRCGFSRGVISRMVNACITYRDRYPGLTPLFPGTVTDRPSAGCALGLGMRSGLLRRPIFLAYRATMLMLRLMVASRLAAPFVDPGESLQNKTEKQRRTVATWASAWVPPPPNPSLPLTAFAQLVQTRHCGRSAPSAPD